MTNFLTTFSCISLRKNESTFLRFITHMRLVIVAHCVSNAKCETKLFNLYY